MKLTDNSPMPFGKHKGVPMANVPAAYLLWLLNEVTGAADVKAYIRENLEALKQEIKK